MNKQTVEQALTLTNKIARAETSLKQLKELQDHIQHNRQTFFTTLGGALNSVADHVDFSPAIDVLIQLVERHLEGSEQELADL